ncbi:MAG: membrane integrity-associated transporter subunit PqiC [Sphingomonadaceae bacterium]|nr:membrane integrity-associated transporter subunit PqiC [Sphingomonadaceae bacterium]
MIKPLFALAMALPLAGCISFGAKPPKQLLTLSAATPVAAGAARTAGPGETVTVLYPSPAAAISGNRVPVYDGATAIAYVKDALWVDSPSHQFQRLLSETIAAKTDRVVLDLRQYTFDPGTRLTGSLLAFGVDSGKMEAVVTYDGVLARGANQVETRRFEARVPLTVIDPLSAGAALNQAANTVAADVAAWVGR